MLAADWYGTKYPVCSGSYAGERKDEPGTGVFLTAGHCVSWLSDAGATVGQLYVTFDSTTTYDLAADAAVTGATTWYRAKAVAFDPALNHDRANANGGLGGICLWDSGSPKLIPGTDTAVAVTTDADGRCRAESTDQRLDVADARAFLGRFLDLP
jgi:hypothetical protein